MVTSKFKWNTGMMFRKLSIPLIVLTYTKCIFKEISTIKEKDETLDYIRFKLSINISGVATIDTTTYLSLCAQTNQQKK